MSKLVIYMVDIALVAKQISVTALIRRISLLVVISLPFQKFPQTMWSGGVVDTENIPIFLKMMSFIDEASFFVFFAMLVSFILLRPEYYRIKRFPFIKWFLFFILVCLAEIGVNRVPMTQGVFGIYNYVKNIAVIFLFAGLNFDEEDLARIIKAVTIVAVILSVVGILGEFFAIAFGKGINIFVTDVKRFGLYRVISLTGSGNWNYIGIYSVLVFFLVFANRNRIQFSRLKLALIGLLVLLSFSRQAWLGFLVLIFSFVNKRTALLLALLFAIIAVPAVVFYAEFSEFAHFSGSLDEERYFRLFALLESARIFVNDPVLGVGPGMFGGLTSILFKSPIYDKWPVYFKDFAYNIHGTDQFWPVLWADTGILGGMAYSMIFVTLFFYVRKAARFYHAIGKMEIAGIGRALYMFIIAIGIMGFATGLNAAFVTFTYFALTGMYLSLYHRDKSRHVDDCGDYFKLP